MALAMAMTNCTPQQEQQEVNVPSEASVTTASVIDADNWPTVETPPLNPELESRVDEILSKLTLEQKVGQVIQADSGSVKPEEVNEYRLGSVLSGGNSAPGPLPYADSPT